MEFTYELPNERNLLNTVLTILQSSVDVEDKIVYEMVKASTLSYEETTDYSHQRWNAFNLGITFRMPTTDYAKNSKLLPGAKSKLLEICSKTIPAECGYDLTSVDIVPEISTTKVDAIDEIANLAYLMNEETENIGARRLHTILEILLEDISYNLPDPDMGDVRIDREYVLDKLGEKIKEVDVDKYIL